MPQITGGPVEKSLTVDEKGHRLYTLKWRIWTDSISPGSADGPTNILLTPGLPLPGTIWQLDADVDVWAYCLPNAEITSETPGKPSNTWFVTQTFTTKPIERRLTVGRQADPMFEPPRVSGSFVKFTEEGVFDRFGLPIANSAHELFRGPQNEWDMARATIQIEQNVPILGLDVIHTMIDSVNDLPMWGFPARFIKLQNVTFKEMFHRFSSFWFRTLQFEVWARKDESGTIISGWDRLILDEGSKALRGRWVNEGTAAAPQWNWELVGSPDANNPADFIRFTDIHGNLTRVILDGSGRPYIPDQGPTTTGCSQCSSGAPETWVVSGLDGLLDDEGLDSFYNGVEMAHTSGCSWLYPQDDEGITFTLEYVTPNWLLTVSGFSSGTALYELVGTSWACLGSNRMTLQTGPAIAASALTVSPKGATGSRPGRRLTQKYHGANYFLLGGVPAVIGP